jgi:prolipoprotein diacylglyceryltransferase
MQDFLFIDWSPDPQIFGLPFRWYGLLFASSFFFGYILMVRIFRKENIPPKWLESLTIYMAVGTVVGARLGHCFFYDPEYYLAHPLEILQVWKGGLASHGAAIGIILSLFFWSRRISKRSILWALDRIVIMVALSGLLIRTGNLMNSEILGVPTEVPWAFNFPLADQEGQELQARWKKDQVSLTFSPQPVNFPRSFSIYRTYDDKNYLELPAPMSVLQGAKSGKMNDLSAEKKARVIYLAENIGKSTTTEARGQDSTDLRKAVFVQRYDPEAASFGGQWDGANLRIHLEIIGMSKQAQFTAYLLRRYEADAPGAWTLVHRGVLSGAGERAVIDTVDTPAPGSNPVYRLALKSTETQLIARHPAQLYEAIAYTCVFIFLLWLYYRKQGKIPYGQFFGLFLFLVFGFRFVVEFVKEGFVDSLANSPINMGQILSIPFVLLGVFFVVRAGMKGYTEPPEIPASEYESPEKKKSGSSKKKS